MRLLATISRVSSRLSSSRETRRLRIPSSRHSLVQEPCDPEAAKPKPHRPATEPRRTRPENPTAWAKFHSSTIQPAWQPRRRYVTRTTQQNHPPPEGRTLYSQPAAEATVFFRQARQPASRQPPIFESTHPTPPGTARRVGERLFRRFIRARQPVFFIAAALFSKRFSVRPVDRSDLSPEATHRDRSHSFLQSFQDPGAFAPPLRTVRPVGEAGM